MLEARCLDVGFTALGLPESQKQTKRWPNTYTKATTARGPGTVYGFGCIGFRIQGVGSKHGSTGAHGLGITLVTQHSLSWEVYSRFTQGFDEIQPQEGSPDRSCVLAWALSTYPKGPGISLGGSGIS